MIRQSINSGKSKKTIHDLRNVVSILDKIELELLDQSDIDFCDIGLVEKLGIVKVLLNAELPENKNSIMRLVIK